MLNRSLHTARKKFQRFSGRGTHGPRMIRLLAWASVLLFYRFYSETKVTSKYLLVALFNASKREGKSVETVLPIKAGFSQA